VTLLEKYFIDPPLKNVFFISRGIYIERKKIIMGKTIRLTESEFISLVKKVLNESGKMTISEADGGWNAQLGKQMGDPSWLAYPAGQLPTTVVSKFNTPNYTQQYTYMAGDTGHDFAIIIPANTQWRRTPSGYFLIGSGMKVVGGDFDKVRGYKDTNYLNQVLKNYKTMGIQLAPVGIAATKDVGGILYPQGDSPIGLLANASQLYAKIKTL
jgi:hypothetical protein